MIGLFYKSSLQLIKLLKNSFFKALEIFKFDAADFKIFSVKATNKIKLMNIYIIFVIIQ